MKRKEKQKKKYLGRRSFGGGNVKNRRGSGNRGGRGNAGLHKHKYSWTVKYAPDMFGKTGFVRPKTKHIKTIPIFEINRKAILNKLEKKDNKYYFEFNGKVLGNGDVSMPLFVKAVSWSKSVEEKIKNNGGIIERIEKTAKTG